ncbi:hypothetical protein BD414DRAFT_438295 [Trametes punicea]|nr:hypothetical protein BD414DRAFT_438295 [Trametes punicea]
MSSSDSGVFRKFDDTDPGLVFSPGDWFDNTGIAGAFNNTLSSTIKEGATVHIQFEASQVVIIGATVAPAGAASDSGPVSGYTLDGAHNSLFLYQADLQNATGVTFFNSGPLTFATHTLDISIVKITDNIPYLLDAVFLQQPMSTSTSTAVWVSTVFITPSAASSNLADKSVSGGASSSSTPVGAIVGGVVGVAALLVCVVVALWFLYFRRRHGVYAYKSFGGRALFDSEKDHVAGASQIEPFLAPAPTTTYSDDPPATPRPVSGVISTPALTPHTYPPSSSSGASRSRTVSGSERTLSVANDVSEATYLSPAQRKAAELRQQALPQPGPVQFHADSGVRFDSLGRPIEPSTSEVVPLADVPPEYTPS